MSLLVATLLIAQAWKPYTMGDGFSLSLPSAPTVYEEGTSKAQGTEIWLSNHPQAGIAFGFTKIEPEEGVTSDDLMAGYMAGVFEGEETMILEKQRDIALNGWPGLEFLTKDQDGYMLNRVYQAKNQLYYMVVTSATEKAVAPVAQKLFGSFSFPKNIEKGPLTKVGPTFTPFDLGSGFSISFPKPPKRRRFRFRGISSTSCLTATRPPSVIGSSSRR